jgi:hypothetical protein
MPSVWAKARPVIRSPDASSRRACARRPGGRLVSSCRCRWCSPTLAAIAARCAIPGPGVVGDVLPGPARSTPSAARRKRAAEGVTLPDLAAPGVALAAWSAMPPLRPVTGPPLPSSRVQPSPCSLRACSCRVLVLEDSDGTRPAKPSARPVSRRLRHSAVAGRSVSATVERVSTGNGRRRRTAPSSAPS